MCVTHDRDTLTAQYHQTTKGHQRLAAEAKKRIAQLGNSRH